MFCEKRLNSTIRQNFSLVKLGNIKTSADKKLQVAKMTKFFSLLGKNKIVGKGENAGYQHFLLLPQFFFFLKDLFLLVHKSQHS